MCRVEQRKILNRAAVDSCSLLYFHGGHPECISEGWTSLLLGFKWHLTVWEGLWTLPTPSTQQLLSPRVMASTGDAFNRKIAAVFCRDLLDSCGAAELRKQDGFSVIFSYCVSRGLLTCSGLCPFAQFTSLEIYRQKMALQCSLSRPPWRLTLWFFNGQYLLHCPPTNPTIHVPLLWGVCTYYSTGFSRRSS